MQESRRSVRFEIHKMVQVSLGQERVLETQALNVSQHGLLCETTVRVAPQTRLYLMLGLPLEGQVVQVPAEGTVVRVEETPMGHFRLGIELKEAPTDLALKWLG